MTDADFARLRAAIVLADSLLTGSLFLPVRWAVRVARAQLFDALVRETARRNNLPTEPAKGPTGEMMN